MNKKFLSIAASTAIVASALVFTGCGDSDSSSTAAASSTTTSGTSTGYFVKGLWSGLSYSTNSSVSGTTGTGGTYTYKNSNDQVQFDLGLCKVNATAATVIDGATVTGANAVTYVRTNGTAYTAAQQTNVLNNVLNTVLTFVNSSTAESSSGYDAATLVTNLKKLQAKGLDLTESGTTFPTSLGANMSAAGVTGNITDPATAQAQIEDFKRAIARTVADKKATVLAATAVNSLNKTRMSNLVLTFANGGQVNLTTGHPTMGMNTTNATGLKTGGGTGTYTTFGSWNASGDVVKLGNENMSTLNQTFIRFKGALKEGVGVELVDNNGNVTTTTLSKIQTNLYFLNSTAGRVTNFTVKDGYGTPLFTARLEAGNVTSAVQFTGTSTWGNSSIIYPNGTVYTGNWTMPTDNTTVCLLNVTGDQTGALTPGAIGAGVAGNYTNLSFDTDPVQNSGILSSIIVKFTDTLSRWASIILSLFQ